MGNCQCNLEEGSFSPHFRAEGHYSQATRHSATQFSPGCKHSGDQGDTSDYARNNGGKQFKRKESADSIIDLLPEHILPAEESDPLHEKKSLILEQSSYYVGRSIAVGRNGVVKECRDKVG